MTAARRVLLALTIAITTFTASVTPSAARSVGQVIDDSVITTGVKAKLAADKLSSLTKIEVKTTDGIVTLNGTVDDPVRRERAAQITSTVDGVRAIVNNIHVAGSTVPAAPIATAPPVTGTFTGPVTGTVDATGVISSIDPATGTITLQDGRMLRVTNQTMVWQPGTFQGLRPGAQVLIRDATPVAVQPNAAVTTPEWRMGTVRTVDRTSGVLVLTDNTVVRVGPSAVVRRGSERVSLDQIAPGSEIVGRTFPPTYRGPAEGSALPGGAFAIDASEINVVWTPVGIRR